MKKDLPQVVATTSNEKTVSEDKTGLLNIEDPDEDDLDDLDDLLDDFSTKEPSKAANSHALPQSDGIRDQAHEQDFSDMDPTEFGKKLQEQMAALMDEVNETPEMKKEIEAIMQELGTELESEEVGKLDQDTKASGSSSSEKPFQEQIRRTMERMQVSGEQAASASASEDPDNIIAQLLQEMQGGTFDGGENEEEFSKMLTGMMEQLTNKDILFEPMTELHEKFPEWMEKNRNKINEDDRRRYKDQQRLVGEIVGKFNEKNYSDNNPADREYIVERMQQMQAAGSPPPDLVGDMNAAQETLEEFDAGCAQQ